MIKPVAPLGAESFIEFGEFNERLNRHIAEVRRAVNQLVDVDASSVALEQLTQSVDQRLAELVAEVSQAMRILVDDLDGQTQVWDRAQFATILQHFSASWIANASVASGAPDLHEAAEIGREAGAQAAAAAAWRRRVGDTLDTEEVTELLGVTRQALDSRKRTGSVLALPGAGTSHYPAWQFDVEATTASVRPITLRIVTTFREALDEVSPFTIAAWATSPQPELDDRTPAEWIVRGGDDDAVVLAALRTAHLEAL